MFREEGAYKIYIAERPAKDIGDGYGSGAHTFLMLVEEGESGLVTIHQQLHFMNDTVHHRLFPSARQGISDPQAYPHRFKEIYVTPVLDGGLQVVGVWNNILNSAFVIGSIETLTLADDFRKAKDALNCRAIVMALLKSVGIETTKDDYAREAGTECKEVQCALNFKQAAAVPALPDLIKSNNVFMQALHVDLATVEGDIPGRFVGPIPNPFQPMRKL